MTTEPEVQAVGLTVEEVEEALERAATIAARDGDADLQQHAAALIERLHETGDPLYAMALGRARRRLAGKRSAVATEAARIADAYSVARGRLDQRIAELDLSLETIAREHREATGGDRGEKHLDIIGAGVRVQLTDRKPTWSIIDAGAFMESLNAEDLDEVTRIPDRVVVASDAKKAMDGLVRALGGEIPPGVERVPARTTSSVQELGGE